MSATQGLFGGGAAGDEQKAKAEDFINRYQTGKPSEGYSEDEAVQALKEVSKVATPEQMQAAFKQSVANLPEDERAQFNQMLQDRKAGTGMVDIERSGDRKEVTSRDTSGSDAAAAPDGGGLDDLLGGLLGSLSGGSGSSGGGGLSDILGGLLGGASGATASAGATDAGKSDDSGGGIGDLLGGLLSSPAGKAVLAGTAAFAMKEVLGGKK